MRLNSSSKKSHVLSPSSLPCLAKISTINVSAGCAHNCIYCYSKGYSNYPGDDAITIYTNLLEKLSYELKRKRKLPNAVYFCPSCDPFQPVKEVLDCTYEIMRLMLKHNIGVQFVTKGTIPNNFLELFSQSPNLVSGQIGIACTDENLRKVLEPGAPSIAQRLSCLGKLSKIGVKIAVRADPLIYQVTDLDAYIQSLCSSISEYSKELAVSYLFLRPAIKKGIERINDKMLVSKILKPYASACKLKIGTCNSTGLALPALIRREGYDRIRAIANKYGITVHACGCKNNDIVLDTCHISKSISQAQAMLF